MTDPARARLLDLYRTRAFSFGRFTLASGKQSSYYVNSKKVLFNGEALTLIADQLYSLIRDLDIQAVGGPEVGAIPIAAAVAVRAHRDGRPLEGFFVRKQPKGHGSQEMVEGVLNPGDRVALVEDVVTTGESVLKAAREVEKAGGKVAVVTCLVDRLEGARDLLAPSYVYRPLFTIRDFGVEPPR
jgi:orotate phosphoribosyltransferase